MGPVIISGVTFLFRLILFVLVFLIIFFLLIFFPVTHSFFNCFDFNILLCSLHLFWYKVIRPRIYIIMISSRVFCQSFLKPISLRYSLTPIGIKNLSPLSLLYASILFSFIVFPSSISLLLPNHITASLFPLLLLIIFLISSISVLYSFILNLHVL